MIFTGDIALPTVGIVIDIPENLCRKEWFVNLEGSLIKNSAASNIVKQKKVFNNEEAIKELKNKLNIKVCSIANNHIEDCAPADISASRLESMNILHVGGGANFEDASRVLELKEGGKSFRFLSFGWDVIKCPIASKNKSGVNPYNRRNVIKAISNNLKACNELVCFLHWGYELEEFPLPYDREFAHLLIDMGVSAVIGCHAHRVQQIEFYKGKPIVYGLGNFIFPHKVFWNGRLKFPSFTQRELAFEITENNEFVAHWFEYDIQNKLLRYCKSNKIAPEMELFDGRADYSKLSSNEYDLYFKRNRYHKKLLPVFKSKETALTYSVKKLFVKMRGRGIDLLVKFSLKAKK